MSIYEKLFPWQKKIVDKYKERESFGIWLDMGLGKTPISLAFAEIHKCEKVLIISINAKALEDEFTNGSFLKWAKTSSIKYNLINKSNLKNYEFNNNENEMLIVNYEYLYSRTKKENNRKKNNLIEIRDVIKQFINSCKNKNLAIIIDECHKMKDSNSVQTITINKIKRLAQMKANKVYTYLLSGTPFTQGYIDLFSQLKFLGYESSKTNFKDTFCILGNVKGLLGWQQPVVGYKNIEGLYNIIHRYAITIKTEEVEDLPDSVTVNISSPISYYFNLFINERLSGKEISTELQRRNLEVNSKYETEKQCLNPFYRNIDYPKEKYLADTPGNFWLRARQLSIGFQGNADNYEIYDKTRFNKLEYFLENNPDNYLLFYNYTPELFEIFQICEKLGYKVDIYSGEIKSEYFYEKYSKQSNVERFNNKKNIILANFASGSTGKNWQLYNKCIIFSTPTYGHYEQGIKRVHRLGQKDTVFYYNFYQQNFLDYGMKKALDEKIEYSIKMFESDKNLSELNKDEKYEI